MTQWALVSALVNGIELAVLIWLLIHLRHSAAPHQAALIEQQRRDLDSVRNTMGRVNADHLQDRRSLLEADSRIWEELRRINERLDLMKCPLSHQDCPLNHREG